MSCVYAGDEPAFSVQGKGPGTSVQPGVRAHPDSLVYRLCFGVNVPWPEMRPFALGQRAVAEVRICGGAAAGRIKHFGGCEADAGLLFAAVGARARTAGDCRFEQLKPAYKMPAVSDQD